MDNEKMIDFSLSDILSDRFARYSKYIIQERALPDLRDGLKPVQRRILFAMYKEGNFFNKPYRKSAKAVGNVIGNYHPHGDSSVYEAMVRMSQFWKNNAMLIDMQGNNGSIDNDPPAAMRYTEARLSKIAGELLKDIEKDTVKMALTFDDTLYEPTVLPARFPNLLVNGAKGIAAGYATDIPPHNLNEVLDGCIYRIDNPNSSLEEIMEIIKGPDFPTGGIVQGKQGIKEAFTTGKGKCVVKAKCEIIETKTINQILVSEIPYDVIKSDLVRSIDQIAFSKKIDGIIEVRDESDKDGLRIVVDLKKEIDPELILNYLYKNTSLQVNYHYNTVVISNNRPMQLGLLELLDSYNEHQLEVNKLKYEFDLKKAESRHHIVLGLIIAIENLDEVIRIIRKSLNKSNAKDNLIENFRISEKQAESIVSLQLYRLTSTDVEELKLEKASLEKEIDYLNSLINSKTKMKNVLKKEYEDIKKEYDSPRKSIVEHEIEEIVINKQDMIAKEDVMISITRRGYAKRSSFRSFNSTEEFIPDLKEDDLLVGVGKACSSDTLLIFTSKGNYIFLPVYELEETPWKSEGIHLNNYVTLTSEEYIISALVVKEFRKDINLVLTTKKGLIKKTPLNEFEVQRYSKTFKCASVEKTKDQLVGVDYVDGDSLIAVISDLGFSVKYHEDEVSLVGVRSSGVKAISNIARYGNLVGMRVIRKGEDELAFILSDKGAYRVVDLKHVVTSGRTNKPTEVFKTFKSDIHLGVYSNRFIKDKSQFVLTNYQTILLDEKEKPESYQRNLKNNLNIKKNESVICGSNIKINEINKELKIYPSTYNNQQKTTKNKDYEEISILDLLGEDF